MLAVVPLACILLFLMIPSFVARHPPPPNNLLDQTQTQSSYYSYHGPALAPPPTIRPASETSKDFFRNLRDLQNSMADFATLHDTLVNLIAPPTNFSNEPLSSTIFLTMFVSTILLFIMAHLLPWRFLSLVVGYGAIICGHPALQESIFQASQKHIAPRRSGAENFLNKLIKSDVIVDEAPETREVEMFELQHRPLTSTSQEWEPWLFSPTPFDPLSPARISGESRPKGTRFFEDVKPPKGWEWADKKWVLDLLSREWVEERMVTGVEIETEGERWVYDMRYRGYPEDEDDVFGKRDSLKAKASKQAKANIRSGWEESSLDPGESNRTGEWRRRRWVRLVKRIVIGGGSNVERTVNQNAAQAK